MISVQLTLELGAVEHLVPALANLLFNIEEQAGGAVVLAEGLLASWSRDAAVIHSAELAGLREKSEGLRTCLQGFFALFR